MMHDPNTWSVSLPWGQRKVCLRMVPKGQHKFPHSGVSIQMEWVLRCFVLLSTRKDSNIFRQTWHKEISAGISGVAWSVCQHEPTFLSSSRFYFGRNVHILRRVWNWMRLTLFEKQTHSRGAWERMPCQIHTQSTARSHTWEMTEQFHEDEWVFSSPKLSQ